MKMNALLSAMLSDPMPGLPWIALSALGLSSVFVLFACFHRRKERNPIFYVKRRNTAKFRIMLSPHCEEEKQLLQYYSQARRIKREAYYQYLNRNARLF